MYVKKKLSKIFCFSFSFKLSYENKTLKKFKTFINKIYIKINK